MTGRLISKRVNALVSEEPRCKTKLPCARITSIRFKGTFSVEVGDGFNTPSGCVIANAMQILSDA
ncbi:hypothetical protein LINBF2_15330 [Limnohabitans sp. INBF002]|nr:hypothetical protein LINBF2_15330 [Limnohabitans sp. INBF002]